jgi:uncharacterized protein (DUF488 family)
MPPLFYALGHSNRSLEFFVGLLLGHEIKRLVDIRTVPRSRHNPQFNRDTLPANLRSVGIAYTHLPGLGGLRRPVPNSPNAGWKNTNFRGYADYMQTPAFEKNLEQLIELGRAAPIAFMCAEAVPWRCHRSLLADALIAKGIPVRQIMSRVSAPAHRVTPFARIRHRRVGYPAPESPVEGETA